MVVYAPVQIISAAAQLITAPAQPPATEAAAYTALLTYVHPWSHWQVTPIVCQFVVWHRPFPLQLFESQSGARLRPSAVKNVRK